MGWDGMGWNEITGEQGRIEQHPISRLVVHAAVHTSATAHPQVVRDTRKTRAIVHTEILQTCSFPIRQCMEVYDNV